MPHERSVLQWQTNSYYSENKMKLNTWLFANYSRQKTTCTWISPTLQRLQSKTNLGKVHYRNTVSSTYYSKSGASETQRFVTYYPPPVGDGVLFSGDFFLSFFLSLFVCLFVCFFVSNIMRKRLDRFSWNFQGRCGVTMATSDHLIKFWVDSGQRVGGSRSICVLSKLLPVELDISFALTLWQHFLSMAADKSVR